MVLTAQPFFNELDLLEIKFRELEGVVDAHVVVESKLTFTGLPKPLYFAENRRRFDRWRVIHSVVELPVSASSPWVREAAQHREIRDVVRALSPEIVLWGDADEIPRRDAVERFRAMRVPTALVDLDCVLFFFDRFDPTQRPSASRIGYYDPAAAVQPWRGQTEIPVLAEAGWHFQYFTFGEREHLRSKLLATSHAVEDDGVSPWSMRRGVEAGELPGIERTVPYSDERLPAFVAANRRRFASAFQPR